MKQGLKAFSSISTQISQKNLFLEFLTDKYLTATVQKIANHFILKRKMSKDQYESLNIITDLQKLIIFLVQKNSSFILKDNNGHIIGMALNLDVKDLMLLLENSSINLSLLQTFGLMNNKIKNLVYKLGDCNKGDYLFNILTVFENQNELIKYTTEYTLRALAFCKIIGWKNILYPTEDPFFMIKLGAKVYEVINQYQRKIPCLDQNSQNYNQRQIQLSINQTIDKISNGQKYYVLLMKMQNIKFKFLDTSKPKILYNLNAQNQQFQIYENSFNNFPFPKL